jgi:hypothetical protein
MAWLSMWWRRLAKKRTIAVVAGLVSLALLFHFWDQKDRVQTYFRGHLEDENDDVPIAR